MTLSSINQIVGIRIKRKDFYKVFIDNEKLKRMMDEKEMIGKKDLPAFKKFLNSNEEVDDTEFYEFCDNIDRTVFDFSINKLTHDVESSEDLIIGKIVSTFHMEIINTDKFPTMEEITEAYNQVKVILDGYGFPTNSIKMYNVQNDCRCCS